MAGLRTPLPARRPAEAPADLDSVAAPVHSAPAMVTGSCPCGEGFHEGKGPFCVASDCPCEHCRHGEGSVDGGHGELRVRVEAPSSPDAQALIAALDADLAQHYPRDVIFGLHDEDHDPAHMVFLVARRGGAPVACGALRTLAADTGEVKRMYVAPAERGQGLSRRLLATVEAIAIGRGHATLRLETGNLSPAALSLYRSSGYREISAYGEYAGNPYSVCFEKVL